MNSNLCEMAKILLVDALASAQENGESEVLKKIPSLVYPGQDLCKTVPAILQEQGVTLDEGVQALLPEMEKVIQSVNRFWNGKLTVEELSSKFGSEVYTTLALSAVGHGVSLGDDPIVREYLISRKVKEPHGLYYIGSGIVEDAAYLIERQLEVR